MRAQLIPLDGGAPIDITKDLTLVGRKDECDLKIHHKSVSKMHCVLVKTDGLLLLRDLGSTNGTRVNGHRVRRAALLPKDQVSIAGFKYQVHLGPASVGPEKAPPEHEFTQQMDQKEVSKLLHKSQSQSLKDSSEELPAAQIQVNPLPDVYPDDEANPK
jgi:pSer/pThr/pTyr-binding forkhead associated (FHA) protein